MRTRIPAPHMGAVLLTLVCQDNRDAVLEDLLPTKTQAPDHPASEIFCAKVTVTMLALLNALGSQPATLDTVGRTVYALHRAMYGYERIAPGTPTDGADSQARIRTLLKESLADFASAFPAEYQDVQAMRQFLPSPAVLNARTRVLHEAFTSQGGHLERGFRAMSRESALALGGESNPLVVLRFFEATAAHWSAVSASLPKYAIT